VLVYVDNILVFAKEPKITMDELWKLYKLKPESVHKPDVYLGANRKRYNWQVAGLNGLWAAGAMLRTRSEESRPYLPRIIRRQN
jgi:hypothetical protein